MAQRWPSEIDSALAAALAAGMPTRAIRDGLRDGSLPGLSRAYPDLPQRTAYDKLAKVRKRMHEQSSYGRGDDATRQMLSDVANRPESEPSPAKPWRRESAHASPAEPVETDDAGIQRVIAQIRQRDAERLAAQEAAEAPARRILEERERIERERFAPPSEPSKRKKRKVRDPDYPWRVYTVTDHE